MFQEIRLAVLADIKMVGIALRRWRFQTGNFSIEGTSDMNYVCSDLCQVITVSKLTLICLLELPANL